MKKFILKLVIRKVLIDGWNGETLDEAELLREKVLQAEQERLAGKETIDDTMSKSGRLCFRT